MQLNSDDGVESKTGRIYTDLLLKELAPFFWITFAAVNTLEMDWMETSAFVSPIS